MTKSDWEETVARLWELERLKPKYDSVVTGSTAYKVENVDLYRRIAVKDAALLKVQTCHRWLFCRCKKVARQAGKK
ncbi:hypothetical protein [Tellurirhabdus bombi]|uniref:hypothetical protein n=1 Tax=Tellurirhabdus bombi TaxID=2907205 RepID=UPI001F2AB891|nr:hypothetical protein [Tellurirhabdus bombi]